MSLCKISLIAIQLHSCLRLKGLLLSKEKKAWKSGNLAQDTTGMDLLIILQMISSQESGSTNLMKYLIKF